MEGEGEGMMNIGLAVAWIMFTFGVVMASIGAWFLYLEYSGYWHQ